MKDEQLRVLRRIVKIVSGGLLLGVAPRAVHVQNQLKEPPDLFLVQGEQLRETPQLDRAQRKAQAKLSRLCAAQEPPVPAGCSTSGAVKRRVEPVRPGVGRFAGDGEKQEAERSGKFAGDGEEREKLSAAKSKLPLDMDSETGLNRARQNLADIFRRRAALRNSEVVLSKEYHAKQRGSWYGLNPITHTPCPAERCMTEIELNEQLAAPLENFDQQIEPPYHREM